MRRIQEHVMTLATFIAEQKVLGQLVENVAA